MILSIFHCTKIGITLQLVVGHARYRITRAGSFYRTSSPASFSTLKPPAIMAEATSDIFDSYRGEGHSAIVLGYTGGVGKCLIEELARTKVFKKVFLVGRRQVELPASVGPEFEQKVVDFERLDEFADTFKGPDVSFCCMGTTKKKAGAEGFVRVDKDYVLKTAELSKAGGCRHFSLVSSSGANQNSSFLYLKTKGEVEEGLKKLEFDRVSIYRPAFLIVDREESRPTETFARVLMTPIFKLFPTAASVPGRTVAMAMINNLVKPTTDKVETFENKPIHLLGKDN